MAGICGIAVKEKTDENYDYPRSLKLMLNKLGSLESQKSHSEIFKNLYLGNITVISDTKNKNFIHNLELGVFCNIDGLVYVNEEIKGIISWNYKIDPAQEDKEYLPYLYAYYGSEFIHKITGWYNIFLFDEKSNQGLLFNDRLGYLPLFYYESPSLFIFASKIESVIASGLLPAIEFDVVSVGEHLFFNYVVSDHTYIKNINTLSHATLVQFDQHGLRKTHNYWTLSELLVDKQSRKRAGIDLIDEGLKTALNKSVKNNTGSITASLTGGFDSRIVLSYLLSRKNQLHLYSFGHKDSDDITIPKNIALKENISYTPYLLDEKYLSEDFSRNARGTILSSNGTRNYKRSHYLYAIEQISSFTDTTISGIFGDEVLKISGVKPNYVISRNSIDFIASNFDVELITQKFKTDKLWQYLNFEPEYLDEFERRMLLIKQSVSKYETINQKCYHFRFLITLRKYFGAEVTSYNDFCYNFSPFIDFDFLKAYFNSYFCGIYYPFNNDSLLLKRQSLKLYGELVRRNCKRLLYYTTDRGYSMYDAFSFAGIFKILGSHFIRKKNISDTYNTRNTNSIFNKILINDYNDIQPDLIPLKRSAVLTDDDVEMVSLYYWLLNISANYINH
jgi:hypothetical protein